MLCLNRIRHLADKWFIKNKVVNNASWLIGGKIAQMVVSFFVGILTARFLGPDNYGLSNRSAAFISFFTPICTLGISSVIVNELLVNPKKQEELLGSGIGIRCIASILSMIGIQLLIFLMNPGDKLLLWVAFLQSGMLLFQSFDLIEYWYQSRMEAKYISIVGLAAYFLTAMYKVALLILQKNVSWFAFSNTLDYILIAVMYLGLYRFRNKRKLIFRWNTVKELWKKSYEFILSSLMVVIYAQMDKVMLGELMDDASVGLYSVGTAICSMWVFVLAAVINSIRPSIIEAKKSGDKERYETRIVQMYALVLWMGIIVSVGFCLFADIIIGVLYGKAYLGAKAAFRITTWYTGISYLGVARSTWIVCENKQRYEKILAGWGAVANVILNYTLIPVYGICGAAVATLLTQVITNVVLPFVYRDLRENGRLVLRSVIYPVKMIRKLIG